MPEPIIRTATDALIAAMEEAEQLEDVIVVGEMKDGKLLICSTSSDAALQIGLLETAKLTIAVRALRED